MGAAGDQKLAPGGAGAGSGRSTRQELAALRDADPLRVSETGSPKPGDGLSASGQRLRRTVPERLAGRLSGWVTSRPPTPRHGVA